MNIEYKSRAELIEIVLDDIKFYHSEARKHDEFKILGDEIDEFKDKRTSEIISKYPSHEKGKFIEQERKNALKNLEVETCNFINNREIEIEDRIDQEFTQLIFKLEKKIADGEIENIIEAEGGAYHRDSDLDSDLDPDLLPIYKSLSWILLAKKSLESRDCIEKCWSYIAESQFYRGKFNSIIGQKQLRKKTSKGGSATASKTLFTKNEVKQFLENKPIGGWQDIKATQKKIITHFRTTSSDENEDARLSLNSIEKKVPKWLESDPEISFIFKRHQATPDKRS